MLGAFQRLTTAAYAVGRHPAPGDDNRWGMAHIPTSRPMPPETTTQIVFPASRGDRGMVEAMPL